mmetsp:Transcript_46253/g.77113  ORF Transcript_46253/g.77113 Transcript_46253/m.77113 type:complete len:396 (-) Transcript_46253:137-1324(-)|eukprot:CAMPEP_0198206376 /NCGR_PEP_ID=MMETSP1445-20131203/9906_1 /TAXON_ID=36898 /ORGANISM="Pyramimonas sp., Strain CCMP2087" /LENGTH=395 /DNA_ID=CAMNT_0043879041 /DNA_START=43 /DNA_END=1230 /DNA_ORIENTATION=+
MTTAKAKAPRARPPILNRPPEEEFDRSLADALGQATLTQNETYESFRNQLPTLTSSEESQIPLTPFHREQPLPTMLAYDPEAANLAILAEWEGAAEPEQAEDGEEAKELAEPSDENGVAIQSLPKEVTCGFSLDTPARVRVGNFVEDAEEEGEDEGENEYFKAGGMGGSRTHPDAFPPSPVAGPPTKAEGVAATSGGSPSTSQTPHRHLRVVHAAPPPALLDDGDDDDVPEFAMGEADENGETMTFLNDQLPGQRRDQTASSGGAGDGAEDAESAPFEDHKGLKEITSMSGLGVVPQDGDEEEEVQINVLHKRDDDDTDDSHIDALLTAPATEDEGTPEGEGGEGGEDSGEDTVTAFALDPEFDYDNVPLTENPIVKVRKEWKAGCLATTQVDSV